MKETYKINSSKTDFYTYSDNKNSNVVQTFFHQSSISKLKAEKISIIRAEISAYLFEYLSKFQIPNHFVKKLGKNQLYVIHTQSLPISVKIFNFLTLGLKEIFNYQEGKALIFPVLENYYINQKNIKTVVNETHIAGLNIMPLEDFRAINKLSLKVNALLKALFERRNLILTEIELEFGLLNNKLMLCGELSPVNFKIWNVISTNKIDFDYFSFQGENIYEQYNEFKKRLIPGS